MDILAVREVLREAIERARKESAPTLIEARTYRFMGHSMSDPSHGHYRTKSEVEEQRRHDPIKNLTTALEAIGVTNSTFLEELDQKVRDIVEEAVTFAERSPAPEPQELFTDIYVG
jgi:pyruvate dehydrogenase E1 component alpha subunit